MRKYDDPDYNILTEILEWDKEREKKKPRIECPRHGLSLICNRCRKCLPCIIDEKREKTQKWSLEFCLKYRHTFLNLFAPCKDCIRSGKVDDDSIHNPHESLCHPCFDIEYEAHQEKMKEEGRRSLRWERPQKCPHDNEVGYCDDCYYD